MESRIKLIFEKFMSMRFANVSTKGSYYTEWENRFEIGTEWQYADYSNRLVLKSIAPDIYPSDRDKFFIRE